MSRTLREPDRPGPARTISVDPSWCSLRSRPLSLRTRRVRRTEAKAPRVPRFAVTREPEFGRSGLIRRRCRSRCPACTARGSGPSAGLPTFGCRTVPSRPDPRPRDSPHAPDRSTRGRQGAAFASCSPSAEPGMSHHTIYIGHDGGDDTKPGHAGTTSEPAHDGPNSMIKLSAAAVLGDTAAGTATSRANTDRTGPTRAPVTPTLPSSGNPART